MTEAETKAAIEHLERQIKSAIIECERATGIPIYKIQLIKEAGEWKMRVNLDIFTLKHHYRMVQLAFLQTRQDYNGTRHAQILFRPVAPPGRPRLARR